MKTQNVLPVAFLLGFIIIVVAVASVVCTETGNVELAKLFCSSQEKELTDFIIVKLHKANTAGEFYKLWKCASDYNLRIVREFILTEWDSWAVIQIKKAQTTMELQSAKDSSPHYGRAWELALKRLLEFKIEEIKENLNK